MGTEPKSTNITWHHAKIEKSKQEELKGHKGVVMWYTGLSGSGKSTLAIEVERLLFERGYHTYVLDGDNVRHGLNKDLGFSPEDREENIRRIGEVASLFAGAGLLAMTAFISPYRSDRDKARELQTNGSFIEVFCRCGLSTCEERDPKGLYKKARAGEIPEFTGISAPYEAPEKPELTLRTAEQDVDECTKAVIGYLEKRGIVG